jgi:hypothetical protein
VIAALANGSVSVQPSSGGEATNISLDSVAAIFFATTGMSTTTASTAARFRLTLADGSALRTRSLQLDPTAIRFASD